MGEPRPQPRPDQIADLAWFINNPKSGLLHDPGVGKTITASIFTQYAIDHKGSKAVWIQPKSLLKKNRGEIARFTNIDIKDIIVVEGSPAKRKELMQGPGKVWLFTFAGFSTEANIVLDAHTDIGVCLIDEFHLGYSTHKSKRTQNWYMAMRRMWSIIPMSGTIIKGRLSSVYPMLHACAPQYYGSYEAFLAQHAECDAYGNPIGWKNHEKLKNVLSVMSIRRSFSSVYGDQSPVVQIEKCEMSPLQREKYDELSGNGALELEDRFLETKEGIVMVMRLRQILAHPEKVSLPIAWDDTFDPPKAIAWQDYNLLGKEETSGKDEQLLIHIADLEQSGERLVIFSVLVQEQLRIYEMLKKRGLRVGLINGSVSGPDRVRIDQEFRDGKLDVIVGSPATMGVGFNWPFLTKVIFVSLDYQDDNFTQAYKRGIRGVRETPLLVIILEYENSVDQDIFAIVERKSRDYNQIDATKEIIFLTAQKKAPEAGALSMSNI